jgi:hypothetical protein
LFDRNLNYKFIVTGSGSIELKEKIHESLAGRKRVFEMNPVSFSEFVNYKTDYRYEGKLDLFFELEEAKTELLLLEYMNYGGYPRIISENIQSEKHLLMNEIFRSYVEKDLVYLLKIERPEVFQLLIRILASQTGNIINYSELAKKSGLTVSTLKKYLWYAEKTYSVAKLNPYFTNSLKELVKSPCYYFIDLGLRNFALGFLGNLQLPDQLGFVFQNFVFNEIRNNMLLYNEKLQFWRTKDKAEVDFIINKQHSVIPVEVKYSKLAKPEMTRSFRSFIEKYKPGEAWIVNRNFKNELIMNTTKVKFFPFYELFK